MSRRRAELMRIREELAEARRRSLLSGAEHMPTEAQPLLDVMARRIGDVSPAWKSILRSTPDRDDAAARTPVGMPRDLALGVELIYEGWAMHAGASRIAELGDDDHGLAILVGDWCYAAGLCEVADTGNLTAVARLAALVADLAAAHDEPAVELEARWDAALAELLALAGPA